MNAGRAIKAKKLAVIIYFNKTKLDPLAMKVQSKKEGYSIGRDV